jgi:hypothetical protein
VVEDSVECKSVRLEHFLFTAKSYLGRWYKWGGDDPSGFDCSGFVIECLRTAGLLPNTGDWSADKLLCHFRDKTVNIPDRGCLAFYLDSNLRAVHVVICLDPWFGIGAAGGDSKVNSIDGAIERNAFIKIRPLCQSGKLACVNPFL